MTHRVHLEWSLSQQQPNYSQKRQFPLNSRSLNQQNYTLLLKIYIFEEVDWGVCRKRFPWVATHPIS